MNYKVVSAAWTQHKKSSDSAFLKETSSVPQQQALRHLQTAFDRFFSKVSKYPKFKKKKSAQSATYANTAFEWKAGCSNDLRVFKLGRLKIKWSRKFTSAPTTVTITKDCSDRYFVTLCLDEPKPKELKKTKKKIGIDLGIARLATLSNGERVANPRHTMKYADKLAKAQRVLSRRVEGGSRWNRQRLKVAKCHAKIVDCRKDYLDKLTIDLIKRFDVLAIEDLNVRSMVKNHNFAKHVSCASFGQFRLMLEYKAAWYGKEIRVADRFFPSSKRCSSCGFIHDKMPLDVREFKCVSCGVKHDRDENAAKNILKFAKSKV